MGTYRWPFPVGEVCWRLPGGVIPRLLFLCLWMILNAESDNQAFHDIAVSRWFQNVSQWERCYDQSDFLCGYFIRFQWEQYMNQETGFLGRFLESLAYMNVSLFTEGDILFLWDPLDRGYVDEYRPKSNPKLRDLYTRNSWSTIG